MKKTIFTLAALCISGTAFAQGYIGVAGGTTHQRLDCTGTYSCDNNDTGFKLFGGYKFTPEFALEAAYTDFGSAKANVGFPIELATSSVSLGGAAFIPLSPKFTVIGRLGVASNKVKVSSSYYAFSDSEKHTNAYFGAGLGYNVTSQLTLTGAFDTTKFEYGDKWNVHLLSVGLIFGF